MSRCSSVWSPSPAPHSHCTALHTTSQHSPRRCSCNGCAPTVHLSHLEGKGRRRKNMSRACLMSRHYDTTTSSVFCPHDQLPDLFYTLSSNTPFAREDLISTKQFFPTTPTQDTAQQCRCAMWGKVESTVARVAGPLDGSMGDYGEGIS